MGPSESSNNGLLFIKYRKIDHGKSIDFFKGIPLEVFLPIINLIGQVNVSKKWNMHMITFLEDA